MTFPSFWSCLRSFLDKLSDYYYHADIISRVRRGGEEGRREELAWVVGFIICSLSSFNCKASVPNDIPDHNQYIPGNNLKSQEYLEKIKDWTDQQKMILNQKKTKLMVFNFTEKYQFGTRLQLNGDNLEIVDRAKLLGVIIADDLKWEANTESLVKRANMRMELLHT